MEQRPREPGAQKALLCRLEESASVPLSRRCHEDREVAKITKETYLFFFVIIVGFVSFVMGTVTASASVRWFLKLPRHFDHRAPESEP